MVERKKRVKVSQEVAIKLREQIMSGELGAGGMQLPTEHELGVLFEVGRSSVREALTILEVEGLVEVIRGKGSFVKNEIYRNCSVPVIGIQADFFEMVNAKLNEKPASILAVMELRKILECEMVELAASRATPEDIIEIKMALKKFCIASDKQKETVDIDFMLHYSISKASRNEFLSDLIGRLQKVYQRIILSKRKHAKTKEEFEMLINEHTAIIDAIERHDPQGARQAMIVHVDRSHRIVESIVVDHINGE